MGQEWLFLAELAPCIAEIPNCISIVTSSQQLVYFTVEAIRQETPDVKSFVLTRSDGAPFVYHPGQFLTVVVANAEGETRRSYSFSSHPLFDLPTITLRRIPNGVVSRWLFDQVKVGDQIQTIGASGLFMLPEQDKNIDTVFFFCAGSGITPAMSLMKEALEVREHLQVVLIYSNRSKERTVFYDAVTALASRFRGRLKTEFFFSNEQGLDQARLGRLALERLLRKHLVNGERSLFYLCGPHVYMQNIAITLLTEGIPQENIRREIFFSPEPTEKLEPPDRLPHRVNITYRQQVFSLLVQYPTTILQTAKMEGIMLPYSCESGRCGTCAATCTRGEVWMKRNEVLLDKEISQGRVLTCTGYPIGGDVDLHINE